MAGSLVGEEGTSGRKPGIEEKVPQREGGVKKKS